MNSNNRVGADPDALEEILGDRLKPTGAAGPRATIRSITAPALRKPARHKPVMAAGLSILALAALMMGVFAFVGLGGGNAVQATHVEPVFEEDNPTCEDLGYAFEEKFDPAEPGTTTQTITGLGSITLTVDGNDHFFDWTSTFGIDAVIAKGGPDANVYVYDPPSESFGDTGLHAPINNDQPFGISHVSFCYDIELDVSKSAAGTFDTTVTWKIEKSVDPDEHTGFAGDSFESTWTVKATKTEESDNYQVAGTISIFNPSGAPVEVDVSDVLDDGTVASVDCGGGSASGVVPAGGSLHCDYTASPADDSATLNTATVVVTDDSGVGGGVATAPVSFTENVIGDDQVTLDDDRNPAGFPQIIDESTTITYDESFECSSNLGDYDESGHDEDTYPNTATLDGPNTDLESSATVTVDCYILEVTKTANTSRAWEWEIDKKIFDPETETYVDGPLTLVILANGEHTFIAEYQVIVDATPVDEAVSGSISVHNPSPLDATLTEVSDVISGVGAVTVDCGITFPYVLAGGDTLVCTYSSDLPDSEERTNTATATLQNTPSGTTDFSDTVDVSFDDATETDECITVTDDNGTPDDANDDTTLGTVCAVGEGAVSLPHTFDTYTIQIGPFSSPTECGQNLVNTVTFVTNDTKTEDDDQVEVILDCREVFEGCTLTPGYWKTHNDSFWGGAPTDDTWELLGDADGDGDFEGEDEDFFDSGMTYFEVLWTPPQGNAYYNLAFHYIAAELNQLAGASTPPDVLTAFNTATGLFETYTPEQIAAMKGKGGNEIRSQFITLAGILGSYNEGLSGPGHCSEDSTSA